jgi:hypothetical protein
MLGVDTLIIDCEERIGDNWRLRYHQLVLHDPVWYDHMPYVSHSLSYPNTCWASPGGISIQASTGIFGGSFDGRNSTDTSFRRLDGFELHGRKISLATEILADGEQ